MRRIQAYILVLLFFELNLCAQEILVEKPIVIHPTQDKFKAVEYNGSVHAIEGSTAVYKMTVAGFDEIVDVVSCTYTAFNDQSPVDIKSYCHIENGVVTIDDVTLVNLSADADFSVTLEVQEKEKETTTIRNGSTMNIKVYPVPSIPSDKAVDSPDYLKFYGDTEEKLTWTFKGEGGYQWICTWNIDGTEKKVNPYEHERIQEEKNTTLTLNATNIAPDGTTVWDSYTESWDIEVIPNGIVTPSVAVNTPSTPKEIFETHAWPLSVSVDKGNPSSWEYIWLVDGVQISEAGDSYTLASGGSLTSKKDRSVILRVRNHFPEGTKPISGNNYKEWNYSYYATFYPVPTLKWIGSYPANICDGDNVVLGVDIVDYEGISIDNSDYEWSYSWGDSNAKTYDFKGDNKDNEDGILNTIKCTVSGKKKTMDVSNTITLDISQNIIVWPIPIVADLTPSESNRVTCGGRSESLTVHTIGGQKNQWEFSYNKQGEPAITTKDRTYSFQMIRPSEKSVDPITEVYEVRSVNKVENTIRCDKTMQMNVQIYPEPWTPNDISIVDKERKNAKIENGIRTGNSIDLSCDECYGGYPNAWGYVWQLDGNTISTERELTTTINNGYTSNAKDDRRVVTIRCTTMNNYNSERWAYQEYTKHITVYNKPKTPLSIAKKGNGTSGTLIVTTDVSDNDLEGHEYYLVFGYRDGNGNMHDASSQRRQYVGEMRWSTQISSSEIDDPNNTLYVYALWKYDNGVEITSGLRLINGVDENWDGSSYSGNTRTVISDVKIVDNNNKEKTVVPQEYYSPNGAKSNVPSEGLNIIKMGDGSVRKVIFKN